jgi:GNAT superfamily N-acetyltransferase
MSLRSRISSTTPISTARMGKPPGPMLEDYAARVSEGVVWVLEEETVITAMIVLVPAPNYLLLDNIAVSPARQGLGLGRRLLAFAEDEASAARLLRNPALHASDNGGESMPLHFDRLLRDGTRYRSRL